LTTLRRFTTVPRFVALAAGAVLSAVAPFAWAAADEVPPLANVLLLVDTSGSMEFQADGSPVTCNPATPGNTNDKSRWIDLVEVLTGTIEDYSCQELDRTSMQFISEYALASNEPPYDSRYIIPYHRPLSGGCAPGPGAPLSGNPFIYPAVDAIGYHYYSNNTACTFHQRANDGILDAFGRHVRFGLMTFDTATDKGTGYGGLMASAVANTVTGRDGLWSYYLAPTEPGLGPATGWPAGCTVVPGSEPSQELGSRNGSAPPWEGRMVNFGNQNDGVGAFATKNRQIQEILLATRPYGATPIAGMLKDARDFLLKDTSKDPNRIPASLPDSDIASDYGPYRDEFKDCGRTQSIMLITDGQPNMDLRPYCDSSSETPAGKCPYDLPSVTAAELYDEHGIKTHVVGLSLDDVVLGAVTKTCSQIVVGDCTAAAMASNPPLRACCTLNEIAVAGGGTAFYAANAAQLKSMVAKVLSVNLPATSRTRPVIAGGAQGSARFFSGTKPSSLGLWRGMLERQRFVCDDTTTPGVPTPVAPDQASGDDFIYNVNQAGPTNRLIFTTIGDANPGDPIKSAESIRPFVTSSVTDGVGAYSGTTKAETSAAFVLATPPEALGLTTCQDRNDVTISATPCRDMYLEWVLGLDGDVPGDHRCPDQATCNLVGDIYHSTPQVLGRPVAALRDESYARYALLRATRPTVLYTSTNDGFLHAFRVTSNDPDDFDDDEMMVRNADASNEIWAMIPPAVLPTLPHQFPNTHQQLLDGTAAISEVVAVEPTLATDLPTVFERSSTDAQSGAGTWRAVLVQGFGSEHSGYFALDVTNPVPDPNDADNALKGGPRLLWQLTRDNVGKNLFGRGGATPAITTLFFDPTGANTPREVAVAVLPGGPGGRQVPSGTGCPATDRDFASSNIPSGFSARTRVHCYDYNGDSELGARSLTIVRLDTGEIIRTFRQAASEVNSELALRVTTAEIDSPITGQPMPFPPQVGAVANRIFVGDNDGRLWKVDVSSPDPAAWTMKLFFDLYPSSLSFTFADGQPVELPPALSVDELGNMTMNVASGSQELLGVGDTTHHVFALRDTPAGPTVGWYQPLLTGERVLGPMIVFNSAVYFATYAPPLVASACAQGSSKIWGMHFVEPESPTNLALGGAVGPGAVSPEPFADPSTPYLTMQQILGTTETEGVIAGVSVTQQPSCFTETADSLGDDVLGFRGQHMLSQIHTGKVQLLVHTGTKSGASTSGGAINTAAIDLPPPPALSFSSAWATIDE